MVNFSVFYLSLFCVSLFIFVLFRSDDELEDAPVQGPLPLEPDDAPWKRSESGIRKLYVNITYSDLNVENIYKHCYLFDVLFFLFAVFVKCLVKLTTCYFLRLVLNILSYHYPKWLYQLVIHLFWNHLKCDR